MVDVVDLAAAVAQIDERPHHRENVLRRSMRIVSGASRSRRMFIFTRPTAERS